MNDIEALRFESDHALHLFVVMVITISFYFAKLDLRCYLTKNECKGLVLNAAVTKILIAVFDWNHSFTTE